MWHIFSVPTSQMTSFLSSGPTSMSISIPSAPTCALPTVFDFESQEIRSFVLPVAACATSLGGFAPVWTIHRLSRYLSSQSRCLAKSCSAKLNRGYSLHLTSPASSPNRETFGKPSNRLQGTREYHQKMRKNHRIQTVALSSNFGFYGPCL